MSGSRPVGKMISDQTPHWLRGVRKCLDCPESFLAKTTAKYCLECKVKRMEAHERASTRRYNQRKRERKESQDSV